MSRSKCELKLIAHMLEEGSVDTLRMEGIGPGYFTSYYDLALELYKKYDEDGSLPTRERVIETHKDLEEIPDPPDERDIPDYRREIRDWHMKDIFVEEMETLAKTYSSGVLEEIPEQLTAISQKLFHIAKPNQITDLTSHANKRYEYYRERNEAANSGGWLLGPAHPQMDKYIGGYQGGDVIVYGSRTGVGKTFTGLLDTFHIWSKNVPVLVVSYEMTTEQLGFRFDTLNSQQGKNPGFSGYNLRKGIAVKASGVEPVDKIGFATEDHATEYSEYIKRIMDMREREECAPFWVVTPQNTRGRITPSYIKALARELRVGLIFIDYVQLVPADSGVTEERYRLEEVCPAIKDIALSLGIPIILPSQMNRETLKVKEVNDSNFAGSDAVARNADIGTFITKDENVVRYQLLKVRGGPTFRRFAWIWDYDTGVRSVVPYYSTVAEVEDEEEEEEETTVNPWDALKNK